MNTQSISLWGHITVDVIIRETSQGSVQTTAHGGAVTYAGRAAASLGARVRLFSGWPNATPTPSVLTGIDLRTQDLRRPLTFELVYPLTGERRLRLVSGAPPLDWHSLVDQHPAGASAYIAPVMGEVPQELVGALASRNPDSVLVAGGQGWLRRAGLGGAIKPKAPPPPPSLAGLTALVVSIHDHPDIIKWCSGLAKVLPLVFVTQGAEEIRYWHDGVPKRFPVDARPDTAPTGAGDVFGAVLTLELAGAAPIQDALGAACRAASASVGGPGLGDLPQLKNELMDRPDP